MKYDNFYKQYEQLSKSINILNKSIINSSYPLNGYLKQQQNLFQKIMPLIQPINNMNQYFNSIYSSTYIIANLFNNDFNSSLRQTVLQYQNLTSKLADIVKLYDFDYSKLFSDTLSNKFIELSNELIDDFASESSIPDECNDSFNTIKSLTEKHKLTIGDICNIIMVLITIWTFIQSFIPDDRISHMETMMQQTIEAGNELIELQKQELEIEVQQLSEEQKQTQLLQEIVDDNN